MQRVLRSLLCRSFAFRCGSIPVDHTTFETVAHGLYYPNTLDAPKVDGTGQRYMPVAADFNVVRVHSTVLRGGYDPVNDTFSLPFDRIEGNLDREATVVHEAVHAANDVRLREVDELEDETAARIAAECYRGLKSNWKTQTAEPAGKVAREIAMASLGRGQKSFAVSDADLRRMASVLTTDYTAYRPGRRPASGVKMMRGYYIKQP